MLLHPAPGAALWPAAMIVWGPGFTSTPHRHHCVQLVMAKRGFLRVRGGPREAWRRCGGALVRPDVSHEVDARGGTVVIGFIDAESELGRALVGEIDGDIACVPARRVSRWRTLLGSAPSKARVEQWAASVLANRKSIPVIHPGVGRVLSHLQEHLGRSGDWSLQALAGIAKLSPSRFMHAFTESVGVPIRPYIRWLRLQQAACELMDGVSVSAAAHRAGFSDAAHLSRTFRRMLGTSPSEISLRKRMSRGVALS